MRVLFAFVLSLALAVPVLAEPGAHWQVVDAQAAPWADAVSRQVEAYAAAQGPAAVVIVRDDRIAAAWGEVGRRLNVRSVRKSLLGTLYGLAVAEGRIDLDATLAQLGIDDKPPGLTAAEKQARVRDLLAARSGVFHPAAYETGDIRRKRPARGSHPPGSFWFYNNWDFNALGTIYRRATGEDIFRSFARHIAGPIGMEDFSARDGRYVLEAASMHPAYPFSMSARDLARFGLLIRDGGRWNGAEIVPAAWVREATAARSRTDRGDRAYGYLWWVLPPEEWGEGAVIATGYGGQVVAVVPSRRLVAVQTVDLVRTPKGVRTTAFLDLLRSVAATMP